MGIKLFLVSALAIIYCLSTFCMLQKEICVAHADYYLLNNRAISWKDERQFAVIPIASKLNMFTTYGLSEERQEIKLLGFSHPEELGCWSEGNLAKALFEVDNVHADVLVKLSLRPYVNKYNPLVKVKVLANHKEVAKWVFEQGKSHPNTDILIAKEELQKNGRLEFSFQIEGMVSPQSLGYGNDRRKLGIFLSQIIVQPNMGNQNTKKRIFYD